MQDRFISLLYPSVESYDAHQSGECRPSISDDVCDELGLTEIFDLKNGRLSDFFTADVDVILYRQKTLDDMMNVPEIKATLA